MSDREQHLRHWLSELAGRQPVALSAMTNDASFRRYFRASWANDGYVVMDAPPDKEPLASFIAVAHRLREAGLNAPEVLAEERAAGFLLLSDLGDNLYLSSFLQADSKRLERLYGDALSALATMQVCVSSTGLPLYDATLLQREMALFSDWLLEKHLGLSLKEAEKRSLQHCFQQLTQSALAQPQVFVHRDYHSRNLMINQHNPGILDFQDAVCGAVTYDLVSLLRDAYFVLPPAQVTEWALGYQQLALQMGIIQETDEREFLRWFDWMGLQRHIKVAGIFARLYHRDGKAGYLADIPRVLEYLIAVAHTYPAMAELHQLVSERVLPLMLKSLADA